MNEFSLINIFTNLCYSQLQIINLELLIFISKNQFEDLRARCNVLKNMVDVIELNLDITKCF